MKSRPHGAGKLVKCPGGYEAFIPDPLSPEVAMRHYLRAEARHYLEASGLDETNDQGDNAANGERPAPTSQVQVG